MNMKRLLSLLIFSLLLTQGVYSQRHGYNWYFGYGGGMTWMNTQTQISAPVVGGGSGTKTLSGLPRPLTGSALTFHEEGVFGMSDSEGNLMFYSNGVSIFNRNHVIMLNGSGLTGHTSSSQSGIVIPRTGYPNQFIAFTVGAYEQGASSLLCYSIIDMDLAGGLGGVVPTHKNIRLTTEPFHSGVSREQLAAVRHANGTDFWIISMSRGTGVGLALNVWKVDADSVHSACYASYPLSITPAVPDNYTGGLRFSRDGTRYVFDMGHQPASQSNIVFGTFDPATGHFPIMKSLINGHTGYGTEFSPSGEVVYAGPYTALHAYRFDDLLAAGSYAAIPKRIITLPVVDRLYMKQVGPDGRIYMVCLSSSIYVVDDPDDYDNFTVHRLDGLTAGEGRYGLPNYMTHYLAPGPGEISVGTIGDNDTICSGDIPPALISVEDGVGVSSYLWEQSTDSITWTSASGTNNQASYSPPALTAAKTHYRRRVTTISNQTLYSNVVTIVTENCSYFSGTCDYFTDVVWYFGSGGAGVAFKKNNLDQLAPENASGQSLVDTDGNSLVASAPGCRNSIIFYSQHNQLYNAKHQPMMDGAFTGHRAVADGLAACYIGNNRYMMFSVTNAYEAGGTMALQYHIIDMNEDGGYGKRISTTTLESSGMSESVEIIPVPGTSNEYWLVYNMTSANTMRVRKITGSTVGSVVSTLSMSAHSSDGRSYRLKPNAQYNVLALTYTDKVVLLNFNISTGNITLKESVPTSFGYAIHDADFSPDGTYLYFTAGSNTFVQYDIDASTRIFISTSAMNGGGGGLKRGPNGSLYMKRSGATGGLSLVNSPNTPLISTSAFYNFFNFGDGVSSQGRFFSTELTPPAICPAELNQPPVAADDATTASIGGITCISPMLNDFDPDTGDSLSIVSARYMNLSDPSKFTYSISPDGSEICITPTSSAQVGEVYILTYTISDNVIPVDLGAEAEISITIAAELLPGAIGSNQSLCAGDIPAPLTSTTNASGGLGTISYRWQQSTNGGITWNDIPGAAGAGATYTPVGAITTSTIYRRSATASATTAYSNVVIVSIKPLSRPVMIKLTQ